MALDDYNKIKIYKRFNNLSTCTITPKRQNNIKRLLVATDSRKIAHLFHFQPGPAPCPQHPANVFRETADKTTCVLSMRLRLPVCLPACTGKLKIQLIIRVKKAKIFA